MQFNAMVMMALAGAPRIFDLMDEKPEVDDGYVTLVNVELGEDACGMTTAWAKREEATTATCGPGNCERREWPQGADDYRAAEGRFCFKDVTFGYNPDKPCCTTSPGSPSPGQKIALVGATGAGKTTMTNLINRFYDIQQGKILYDGISVKGIRKADLRRIARHRAAGREPVHRHRDGQHPLWPLDATDEECIAAAKLANADASSACCPTATTPC